MAAGHPSDNDISLLYLLMEDLRDQEIAARLFVSVRTLHRRLDTLMAKAGAPTRFALGAHAVSRGWIELPGCEASTEKPLTLTKSAN